jgi:hypothetical protein
VTILGADAVASEPPDCTKDEWAECRATIGRMDSTLADIRKYGFSLVTLLLTANALITNTNAVADRVAASSVVMVLVLVLFLMDRYWWVLLREAVERAIELEIGLGIHVSYRLSEVARRSHNTGAASAVYAIFILLSCGIALVTVAPAGGRALLALILITVVAGAFLFGLHVWFELLLPTRFISSRVAKWLRDQGFGPKAPGITVGGRDREQAGPNLDDATPRAGANT